VKVVFIFDFPVSERDSRRCGFDTLRQNGFDVEVWDVTPFLHPAVDRDVTTPDPLESMSVRRFVRSDEAIAALAGLPRGTFVFLVTFYQLRAIPLYRAIGRLGLPYGVIVANALPQPAVPATVGAFAERLARLTPRRLLWHVVRRLPYPWLGVPGPALVVAGGEQSLASQQSLYPLTSSSHIVWTHALDYDAYLQEQEVPRQVDQTRGVFLDEYLPYHPDFTYLGIEAPSTADAYYPRLRAYFDYLEKAHGRRMVIAAHPRSEYERHADYFGGRPVIRGRTAELVRTSGFVVAHSSTALSYAVMFERPVVFVTTDDLDASPLGRFIADLAARFDSPRLNLNRAENTWQPARAVNKEAYRRYRAAYIKKEGTPEVPCWQIVADELKRRR
jgi:hypothetical protein